MSDLRELYQELILDHGRHPRNFAHPAEPTAVANGHNPLCGDKLSVAVRLEGERITEIGFVGSGCAICMAAASTMTEAVKGKELPEIRRLFSGFIELLVRGGAAEPMAELPPKLRVFSGVAEFPVRVKCATLAWHTLDAALAGQATASSQGDEPKPGGKGG